MTDLEFSILYFEQGPDNNALKHAKRIIAAYRAVEHERNKAMSLVRGYGVPESRAKYLPTAIDVLITRLTREICAEAERADVWQAEERVTSSLLKSEKEQADKAWISVKDRLPRDDERSANYQVIVYRPASKFPVSTESLHPDWWGKDGPETGIPITHWMPFPKPPTPRKGNGKIKKHSTIVFSFGEIKPAEFPVRLEGDWKGDEEDGKVKPVRLEEGEWS